MYLAGYLNQKLPIDFGDEPKKITQRNETKAKGTIYDHYIAIDWLTCNILPVKNIGGIDGSEVRSI